MFELWSSYLFILNVKFLTTIRFDKEKFGFSTSNKIIAQGDISFEYKKFDNIFYNVYVYLHCSKLSNQVLRVNK
jgi:hypothetical protein